MPGAWVRLWIGLAVLLGCTGAALPIWLDQEPAVYRALLKPLVGAQPFAIASFPSRCERTHRGPEIPVDVLAAFERVNSSAASLADLNSLNDLAAIANSRLLNSIEAGYLGQVGPQKLRLLRLSRVGIVGDQALVCIQIAGRPLLLQLDRDADGWHVRAWE